MFYSKKLKKFKNLKHCFFSKNKGFSKGIYKSLNCGYGSRDKPKRVKRNLKKVANKMGVNPNKLILMRQTHSSRVCILNERSTKKNRIKADGIITQSNKIAIGVLTADCVPIIIYDKINNIVGCIHAGWRGALNGVIENTIKKMKTLGDNLFIIASVGPCIGKKNYEVNKDFFKKFILKDRKNTLYFKKKNNKKYLFDLRKFINIRLKRVGVNKIDNINRDTYQEHNNFFSYRRSKKLKDSDYGRCISTIRLIN
tara:strand:- start:3822 stop:4583 length:762 start_codon:yes stop_codon:yes gene_type:complete